MGRRRDSVKLALHKLHAEEKAQAKQDGFIERLQGDLNKGVGFVQTPLVMDDFDAGEQAMLKGLKVW